MLLSSRTRGMSYPDAASHSPLWQDCMTVHDPSGRCVISPHRGDLNGASVNAALQHAVSCAQHPHAQRRLLVQNDPALASAGRSPLSCFKQTSTSWAGDGAFLLSVIVDQVAPADFYRSVVAAEDLPISFRPLSTIGNVGRDLLCTFWAARSL